ncbi:MAG: ATP:cob(I)alamin adenosyltransferase [Anaerorhabdus sp.]|uniref:ATP:cob(I)alamin adenosyltransferase n=1 Tax=Anaerorhabdus sp. TaxID=1872524 RepID=UPI003A87DE6C
MKVSTKLGDTGTTSAYGCRVDKSSTLINTLGELDSCIAECILISSKWDSLSSTCQHIVEDLNCICAIITGYNSSNLFTEKRTKWLEVEMNQESIDEDFHFVYPFHNERAAALNHLRTTVRSVERSLFTLNKEQPVALEILSYINRLSDFWFIIGCKELINECINEGE